MRIYSLFLAITVLGAAAETVEAVSRSWQNAGGWVYILAFMSTLYMSIVDDGSHVSACARLRYGV
jgi:hypothetical protein